LKPRSPEKGRWKSDEGGSQCRKVKTKLTFDLLLNKYIRHAAILKNWPREKLPRSPTRQEANKVQQREVTHPREEVQCEHPFIAPSISQAVNYPMVANLAFYSRGPSVAYSQFPPMAPYVDQPMPYMPPLQQF
jgi:hypothetical protein